MGSDKENSNEKKNRDLPVRGKDWERGFTIEEKRVNEYVELYDSIGYETNVESATPNEVDDCQACFKAEFDNLKTIYIKRKQNKDNEMDLEELF